VLQIISGHSILKHSSLFKCANSSTFRCPFFAMS
jgi:hypothetical protein